MDAAADATTALGAWASVRGYFTPATLFLMLNLVIGTIALTSRSRDQRRRRDQQHLHHDYAHQHHQSAAHYHEPPVHDDPQHEYNNYYQHQYATPPPPAAPAPLARTSSVLDRLRSIGLYRFRSGDFPPEYAANHHDTLFAPVAEEEAAAKQAQYARSRSEPASAREEEKKSRGPPQPRVVKKPAATTTAAVVRKAQQAARAPATTRVVQAVAEDEAVVDARAEEFSIGSLRRVHEPSSPQTKAERTSFHDEQEYVPPPAPMRAPPPISRTSSVLERLRSIGLYSFLAAADQPAAAPAPTPAPAATATKKQPPAPASAHYDRTRSEPAPREQSNKKKQTPEAKMSKSSSATKKPTAAAAGGAKLLAADDDCVDARAEAFIHSFRKEQSQKKVLVHHEEEDDHLAVVPPPPAPLARTSSVLDRLRSFSLYLRSSDPVAGVVPEDPVNKSSSAVAGEKDNKLVQQQYSRSRSEPGKKKAAAKQGAETTARMSKTSSDANIAEEKTEECVDARADDFINKFRQQLQLQRLNSLLSYGGAKQ